MGVAVKALVIRLKLVFLGLAFSLLVFAGDAQKGFDALQKGDYQTALKEIRPLADSGDAWAHTSPPVWLNATAHCLYTSGVTALTNSSRSSVRKIM